MTDPTTQLAAVRRGLDAAAQQATAAAADWNGVVRETQGSRFLVQEHAHIATWSPSHVLAVVGSLRTICDGIEATFERHASDANGYCLAHPPKQFWSRHCPEYALASASLVGLAAVWAPTTEEAKP